MGMTRKPARLNQSPARHSKRDPSRGATRAPDLMPALPFDAAVAPTRLPKHPALAQHQLELRARLRRLRSRPGEALFLLLAWLAAALLAALALRGPAAAHAMSLWTQAQAAGVWLLLPAGLLYGLRCRSALARFRRSSGGWLAALPVAAAVQRQGERRGLLQRAAVDLLALACLTAALGVLLSAPALETLRLTAWLALAMLAGLALVLALDRSAGAPRLGSEDAARSLPSAVHAATARARPRGPLPQTGLLQQRLARRHWRGGRGGIWLLPLGLMVLAGEGARVMAGMLLLVAVLPWWRVRMAAAAQALGQIETLLRASPRRAIDVRASSWQQPALASALMAAALSCALLLFGAGGWLLALFLAGFVLLCSLEIALMLHYPSAPARRRSLLLAEITALALLARDGFGPLVLLPGLLLVAWHVHAAGRRP